MPYFVHIVKNFKNIAALVILSFVFGDAFSQQVPMYSQYIMNGFLVNPSFTGRDGYTTVNLTVREQWVGMSGPSTYAASFQTRILKDSYISKSTNVRQDEVRPTKGGNVGLGGYVFNDQNGIMRRTGFQAAYAYHISLNDANEIPNNLSFGLAFTGYQYFIDYEGRIYDKNDPLMQTLDRSVFITDFNFGASYTTRRYYAGFAMTNLLRGNLIFGDTTKVSKRNELGHFFLTGGVKFPINNDWTFEPSAFLKASDMLFTSAQIDLTGRMYFREDYWAGLSYRTGDALIVMLGIKYDKFYFAYAYDYILTDIRSQTFGSHEFTLAVKFGDNPRRYRWINSY